MTLRMWVLSGANTNAAAKFTRSSCAYDWTVSPWCDFFILGICSVEVSAFNWHGKLCTARSASEARRNQPSGISSEACPILSQCNDRVCTETKLGNLSTRWERDRVPDSPLVHQSLFLQDPISWTYLVRWREDLFEVERRSSIVLAAQLRCPDSSSKPSCWHSSKFACKQATGNKHRKCDRHLAFLEFSTRLKRSKSREKSNTYR